MSLGDGASTAGIGNQEVAAILLREELGKLRSSEQRVDLCRWIAERFEELSDYASAAEWHEMTGLFLLRETSSDEANAMRALPEYEKALAYYSICEDEEKVELCSSVIAQFRRCFSAS